MSRIAYKIIILSGTQQGTEFFLSKRITRLGSDAGCDIQILGDGIPSHAASIDAGGEEIVVFNRGDIPFTVTGQPVPPMGSGVWKQSKAMVLPGQVQLRLERFTVDAVPTASPAWKHEEEEPVASETTGGSTDKPKSPVGTGKPRKSNAGQIAFIAACMVLVILMIAKKLSSDGSTTVAGPQAMTWEKAWTELNDEKRLTDRRYESIRSNLGRLYRLQLATDSETAPQFKSRVLQDLMATNWKEPPETDFPDRLREFVNQLK